MRVTFVLHHVGMAGGNRVLAIYAERLQRRGHVVNVVSLPPFRWSAASRVKALLRGKGWLRNPEPEPSYFDGIDVPHHVLEKVRPVTDGDVPDADVVVATFWRTAPWVEALSPCKGAKAILLQGYETAGDENPEISAAWRLPLHKIVISRWLLDMVRNQFGDANVHLVRNSVDTNQFFAAARGKQPAPTVGMLYSSLYLKGVDVSLSALMKVKARLPRLRALAFGAQRIAPELPLPDWTQYHYRPPQNEIRHIYEQCDVWLCGSRRDGFHLPHMEAMACRCPVVSTRVGGPMETVEDGINGFLVDVEDSDSLAKRLIEVLTKDDAEWRRMSVAALATATRYSWDDATALLERALADVARRQTDKMLVPHRIY